MSVATLKTLTISNLRGATAPFTLAFEKGKKLTVIYGENGTGKSTICDALDLLGNDGVGSLDGRGLGKTSQYWHSLGRSAADVAVTLATATESFQAKLTKGNVVVTPSKGRPRVEVLRRSRILSLLEAAPGARYEAVRQFIDVQGIEAGEAALRDAIKSLDAGRSSAAVRVSEVRDTVERFWHQAGAPAGDPFTWATREAMRDPGAYDVEVRALAALVRSYEQLAHATAQVAQAQTEAAGAHDALAVADADLTGALATATSDAADVVSLLQAARSHLMRHPDVATCPVCESAEHAEGLPERVEVRLAAFATLQRAQETVAMRRQALERATHRVEGLMADAASSANAMAQCIAAAEFPADTPLPGEPFPVDPTDWRNWLASSATLTEAWSTAGRRRADDKNFLGTLRVILESYDEQLEEQRALDELLPRMKRALEILAEERRRFTDETLAAISEEVGRLYEQVHPGEGLNKISLTLDPKKRASLDIAGTFCGQAGMPPGAYFSDSHLDTLGLCVFLALAGRSMPAETVLVLDDVLGSVDEPHVDRLIEMLYEETKRFRHCIITTHYRPWRAKLRWGWLRNGQCQFVELVRWSAVDGLTVVRSVPDAARLRLLLAEAPLDPQLVCGKAGVVLEAVLDFLTLTYQCPVPRKADGAYTLGELLPAIDKKLRAGLAVEVLGVDANGAPGYTRHSLTPFLDELLRIMQARNVIGAHFNRISFDLLDSDAIGFGQQVLGLTELLTCEDEGWPRSDKTGLYWATTGETRRLYPLKRPS